MKQIHPLILAFVLCSCMVSSCALLDPVSDQESTASALLRSDPAHRRAVVLPFINSTDKEGAEAAVRKSFYSHFSSKNYYDFELSEVDSSIRTLEGLYGKPWHKIPAADIGKFFHADFLVYGEVRRLRRLYLLFYSQIALTVSARMVETRRGKVVWEDTVVKRLQSADFPLHPFSLVPAAVRSGFNIAEERKMDLVERTCRAIVERIPEMPAAPAAGFKADIQIASFSDKKRAYQALSELQDKGYRPRIERVRLSSLLWYRVLIGPYARQEAEQVKRMLSADNRYYPILIYHAGESKRR